MESSVVRQTYGSYEETLVSWIWIMTISEQWFIFKVVCIIRWNYLKAASFTNFKSVFTRSYYLSPTEKFKNPTGIYLTELLFRCELRLDLYGCYFFIKSSFRNTHIIVSFFSNIVTKFCFVNYTLYFFHKSNFCENRFLKPVSASSCSLIQFFLLYVIIKWSNVKTILYFRNNL